METDIWGQLALEASQVYLTDGVKRSPFADTVLNLIRFSFEIQILDIILLLMCRNM